MEETPVHEGKAGGVAVVKLQLVAAKALPAKSRIPVDNDTVYVVDEFKAELGVNVALVDVVVTVPATDGLVVMLVVFSVDVFIASLNTTVMAVLTATPVALTPGVRLETVGDVESSTYVPVAQPALQLPAASCTRVQKVLDVLSVTVREKLYVPVEATVATCVVPQPPV